MSPEQARGLRIDHRSDIFSFGTVLYEMLAGFPPFRRSTTADTLSAIVNDEPPDLSAAAPVHGALERVVRHCLEKEPGARFQSARDLVFDLESLSHATGTTPAIGAATSRLAESSARSIAVGLLGVSAVARARLSRVDASRAGGRLDDRSQRPPRDRLPGSRGVSIDLPGPEVRGIHGEREWTTPDLRAPAGERRAAADHQGPCRSPTPSMVAGRKLAPVLLAGRARRRAGNDLEHSRAGWRSPSGHRQHRRRRRQQRWAGDVLQPRGRADSTADVRARRLRRARDRTIRCRLSPISALVAGRPLDCVSNEATACRYDIFVVSARGGEPRQLTHDRNIMSGLAWLPDSTGVVYGSSRGSTVPYLPPLRLWEVRLDGRALARSRRPRCRTNSRTSTTRGSSLPRGCGCGSTSGGFRSVVSRRKTSARACR